MKLALLLPVLVLVGVATPAQSPVAGDWKAVFIGPMGPRPKMVDAITFSIRESPNGLMGTARASQWPGDLEVTELKLDGDRLSFTGTGKLGSATVYQGVRTEYCCPKLIFEGNIRGSEIDIALTWASTDPQASGRSDPLPMLAKRVME